MRNLSKIEISGSTSFSKDKLENQVISLVEDRLTTLDKKIKKLRNDIYSYEKESSMSNETFLEKYKKRLLHENKFYMVWKDSVDLLNSLEEEKNMLTEVL